MKEKHLSDTCWDLWILIYRIWFGIPILLSALGWGIPFALRENVPFLWLIPATLMVLSAYYHYYMRAYWKKFHFSYDGRELRVFSGVWWQKQILIPFSRITNVDIMQGPWQRSRKVATLKIQTAGKGANSVAEAQLWSQEDFEELRDDFLQRIAKSRSIKTVDNSDTQALGEKADLNTNLQSMIKILKSIEKNTIKNGK